MRTGKIYNGIVLGFITALFWVVNPNVARATIILNQTWTTDVQCGGDGCFGSTYQLIIDDGGTDDNNFTARLIVDASNYSPPGGKTGYDFISAVDFKVASSVISASLTAAPGNLSDWHVAFNAGQVSGDCGGSGNGFVCGNDIGTNSAAPVPNATPYEWDFSFSLAAGKDNSDISFSHLGTRYCTAADTCTGVIVSIDQPGSPGEKVPEPSTMLLLGAGLIGLATWGRGRLGQRAETM